jgi:hypothetical protein
LLSCEDMAKGAILDVHTDLRKNKQ